MAEVLSAEEIEMLNRQFLIALAGLACLGATLSAACFDYANDCRLLATCCPDGTLDCLTTNTGGHDGGTGGSGSDCSGDPSSANVVDACGVFAQADAPAGGDGTMAMPYATLGDAVTTAQTAGKRVYACTSAPFKEAVTISAGIEVYGGLDCTKGWSWSQTARAMLDGPADAVALTVTSTASGAMVEGFAIMGASPSSMTMRGSSIAMVVDDVAATLDNCDVKANDAADGADGTTPSTPVTQGAGAPLPVDGQEDACINAASLVGGAPGTMMCGTVDTSGGVGGKGGITGTMDGNGQPGASGANPATMPKVGMDGLGGVGQTDPAGTCTNGDQGAPGGNGAAGEGGSAMGDALTITGIGNSDDTDGQPGTPGQGGGGGGGAMSGMFCPGGVDGNGASGGGGGAGGCGGLGGGGGNAGGSSIAIVSLGTSLTLTAVTLAVGTGGKGGNGVTGQNGGVGGNGASGGAASATPPSNPGCNGLDGGKGGAGGPGGGGRGGHAVGIAYAKTPAAGPTVTTFTSGAPGAGGTAGSGAPASSNGMSGIQGPCWDFSANLACK